MQTTEQLQIQVNELKERFDEILQYSTIPYTLEVALLERIKKNLFIYATATINFASTAAQTITDNTITVPGANLGDLVILGVPSGSASGGVYSAWVSSDGVITVRFANHTAGALNPAEGVFKVTVLKT